ncbi:ClpXP protease specificity-enhancing factor [Piscinibacter sakaiensis]|uniref:ClpXP protease specificity-enhancing factor n=1 Tax=Piscinibacter sakaiensis TaxID=1547922 RepID=UPI003AAECC7F
MTNAPPPPPAPPSTATGTSTRPYLIRALHDWCTDNGFTPYIAVFVDSTVQVPMEYVKNNEIVLNVGFEATSGMKLGNDWIEFKARFGGSPRSIQVPVDHVIAIYARENGQGMAFPMPAEGQSGATADDTQGRQGGLRLASDDSASDAADGAEDGSPDAPPPGDNTPPSGPRPALKRIK